MYSYVFYIHTYYGLALTVAGPTITATTGTDFTEIQNTLREGNSQLYVTTVRIADLNTDKQGRDILNYLIN